MTCDACLAGRHLRCHDLACTCSVCAVARSPHRKLTLARSLEPRQRSRKPRKPVVRDHAAEYAARPPAPINPVHKPCAGTGWRPTPSGELAPCFCRTSTMRRNRTAA